MVAFLLDEPIASLTLLALKISNVFFTSSLQFCRELGFPNFSTFKSSLDNTYGFEIDYNNEYKDIHIPIHKKLDYFQNETLESLKVSSKSSDYIVFSSLTRVIIAILKSKSQI